MSKQLESILARATTATPKPSSIINAPEPSQAELSGKSRQSSAKEDRVASVAALKAEPQKAIQAYVPASVAKALSVKAAEEGVTVRVLLLRALKKEGYSVPEEEIKDRRK